MSKILIVGDIHLGKGLSIGKPGIGNALNSRIIDQIKLLDWILSISVEKYVSDIILTGDVFEDVKPDFQLVNIFIDWLKKIELENISCHIVAGNHDIKRTGSFYTSVLDIISKFDFDKVFFYKNINTIELNNACVTFLPYRDKRGLNAETNTDALKYLDNCLEYESLCMSPGKDKILIGHLSLEGAVYVGDEVDDQINELICPLYMFRNYHYVWMGHVHKPQIKSKQPYIAHIGSLDLSDYGETDHVKNLILFDSTLPNKFETILVPSRPLKRVKIIIEEDMDSTAIVINNINENIPYTNALVKIEVVLNGQNAIQVDKKKIEEHIYQLGAYYISNLSESRNISVIPAHQRELLDSTVDPKSAVKLFASTQKFESEIEENDFILLCNETIDEFNITNKGN